jgi:hypothetical protein
MRYGLLLLVLARLLLTAKASTQRLIETRTSLAPGPYHVFGEAMIALVEDLRDEVLT